MQSRILIYTRLGVPIAELQADVDRNWILDDVGAATFVLSLKDPKLTRENIEFGNLIVISSPYVKPWVGVIDTPRSWLTGGVRVKAYSAERLLSYRTPVKVNFSKKTIVDPEVLEGTSGALFAQIIERVNREEDTLIRLGDIWIGDQTRQQTLSTGHYLKHVIEIADRVPCDYEIIPIISDRGMLTLKANWLQRKGQDKSAWLVLEEGENMEIESEGLTEQGEIFNQVTGVSEGSTTNTRFAHMTENADSRARYGLRQSDANNFYGVTQLETVVSNTQTILDKSRAPRKLLRAAVTDKTLFAKIQEGDTVTMLLHKAGFRDDGSLGLLTTSRVLGMGLNDTKARLELVMSEVL